MGHAERETADGRPHRHRPPDDASCDPVSRRVRRVFHPEYVGLVRLVWLIVGSQPAAEDAVQDAFVVLHRRWADVQRPGAFVRTAALNNARRVARRATVERRLIRRALPLAGSQPAPDEHLADALRRLPLRQRTAVVLRYYDEAHIAAVLGCAPGTVKSLLSRAKAALRDSLDEGEIRRTSSTRDTTSTGETSSTVSSAIGSTSAHRRSPRMSPAHVNPFVQWSVVAGVCDASDSPARSRLLSWFRSP